MFKFFRKHKTVVFVFLALVILGLPFFGIGTNYLFSSPQDVVMKINGEKVTQMEFNRIYNQFLRQAKSDKESEKTNLKSQALNEIIRLSVFEQEANRFGIVVPDQELQLVLAMTPSFQKDGKFDPQIYVQTVVQVMGMTPHEFERLRKKDLAAMKLNQLLASTVHVTDEELNNAMNARLALETDTKKKKELHDNPELLRDEIKNRKLNFVYNDWLSSINSNLRVTMVSEQFRQDLASGS